MRTVIEYAGDRLVIELGRWSSDNPRLAHIASVVRAEDVRGYHPDLDYPMARLFVERFGGRIVESESPRTDADPPDRVY